MSQLVFPSLPGIAWPVTRTVVSPPVRTKTTASQREFRARDATIPRYRYTLSFEFLRRTQGFQEWQQLVGFANQVGGPFDDWLFEDVDDRSVSNQVFAIADGVRTTYQLARTLGSYLEPVYGPLGTPAVTVNNTAATPTVGPTGAVTFASPPANGATLRWSGTFAWRCRFLKEELEFSKNFSTFYEAKRVEFITIKPD